MLSVKNLGRKGEVFSFMLTEEGNGVAVLFDKANWRVVKCSSCERNCIHSDAVEQYIEMMDDNFNWYDLIMWVFDYYCLRRQRVLWWKLTDGLIAPDHPMALKIRRADNEERAGLRKELYTKMIQSVNRKLETMSIEVIAYLTMIGLPEGINREDLSPKWNEGFIWGSESGLFLECFRFGIGG